MWVPTGRYERRVQKAEVVELSYLDEPPGKRIEATIENVSSRGARLITNSICTPGKLVRLDAPEEPLSLPALVVYCKRLEEDKFAVGLRLNVRVDKWQKPSNS